MGCYLLSNLVWERCVPSGCYEAGITSELVLKIRAYAHHAKRTTKARQCRLAWAIHSCTRFQSLHIVVPGFRDNYNMDHSYIDFSST